MISVIISTYNSEKYIKACLEAVLGSRGVDFEVVVVDAGTKKIQNSKLKIKNLNAKFKNIKIKFLHQNVGLTVSNNVGARIAEGKYLLFLDVDTKMDKNALSEIVKFFESHPEAGAVQGKLVGANGKVETMGHFLSVFGFPYDVNKITNYQLPITNEASNSKIQKNLPLIFGARGACLAIRKSVFDGVGGFDEDYFMHGEETDLCWRVWLSGYRIYYVPGAIVRHYGKSHYGQNSKFKIQNSKVYKRVFYEGAKNQITTIIKNADLKMILLMVPLNILGWMGLSLKFLLTGQVKKCLWICEGVIKAFLDLGKTIKKRKKIIRARDNEVEKVMFGRIRAFDLLKKGLRWVRYV